jgi:hypothetical protein
MLVAVSVSFYFSGCFFILFSVTSNRKPITTVHTVQTTTLHNNSSAYTYFHPVFCSFWGSTNETAIRHRIFDSDDDDAKATVRYLPYTDASGRVQRSAVQRSTWHVSDWIS